MCKAHISRALKEFTERGLVKYLTPNERLGKVYEITEEGRKLIEKVKSFEG